MQALGFSSGLSLTVGLEEELILVDPATLEPVDAVEWVLRQLPLDHRFTAELRACQVELRTPVCPTVADACRELAAAGKLLRAHLGGRLHVMAVGTHPTGTAPVVVTTRERYRRIVGECAWAVRRGQPSGLHVHVGVSDADDALAVYNAARSYLPELAALAANSPFFEGGDSGLASARLKLTEDLPRSGIPPAFESWQGLAEFARWARTDLSRLWWDLRPRPDYGTLEFRVPDAQLCCGDTGAIAAVCQALVAMLLERRRRGLPLPVHESHRLAENRWRALRDGLDGELVDLTTGDVQPTRARIARLLATLEPHADELGSSGDLTAAWSLLEANGATRQRAVAAQGGTRGLLEWLANGSEPDDGADLEEREVLLPAS